MAIKYYIKAPVSEYTDKDGATKKRYSTVGIVTETKKGDLMMKLETLPFFSLKEGALWAYLNVPEEEGATKHTKPAENLNSIEDDIPF